MIWLVGSLVGIGLVLCAQALLGARLRGPVGSFMILQCFYMAMAWLARPLVVLVVQPAPRRDDQIADPRFASLGYDVVLSTLLPLALLGLASCLAVYFAFRNHMRTWTLSASIPTVGIAALWVTGWAFRFAWTTHPVSGVLETFSTLAAVAAGAYIFYGRSSPAHRMLCLVAVVGGEFYWSVASASKAPILACVLWIVMKQFSDGRTRWRNFALVAVGGVASFLVVQQVKVDQGILTSNDSFGRAYPALLRPVLYLVRRFDHLSALGDAYFAGVGRWLTLPEVGRTLLGSFVPQQLLEDKGANIGARWANEVRAYSVPNSNTGVHLAEGPIAEGYLLGGIVGIVVESVVLAVIALLVLRCLCRDGRYLRLLGLAITTQPTLFERGLLGVGEGIGKSVQVALIGTCVLAVACRLTAQPGVFVPPLPRPAGRGTTSEGVHRCQQSLR